jgi:hypothetical protein
VEIYQGKENLFERRRTTTTIIIIIIIIIIINHGVEPSLRR